MTTPEITFLDQNSGKIYDKYRSYIEFKNADSCKLYSTTDNGDTWQPAPEMTESSYGGEYGNGVKWISYNEYLPVETNGLKWILKNENATIESAIAYVTVAELPILGDISVLQSKSFPLTIDLDCTATHTVAYRWRVKLPNSSVWKYINTVSANSSFSYTVPYADTLRGVYQFQVLLTASETSIFSDTVYFSPQFFGGGSGTDDDPYLISSPVHLATIAEMVNASIGDFTSACYKQTANIDLSDYSDWVPIGITTNFMGKYYGNGFIISNLTIHRIVDESRGYHRLGLFSHVTNAVINGVRLHKVRIFARGIAEDTITQLFYIGGLATLINGSTISDCMIYDFEVSIETGLSSPIIGGFAYIIGTSTISRCCVIDNTTDYGNSAGFAMDVRDGSTITDCFTYNVRGAITPDTAGTGRNSAFVDALWSGSIMDKCYSYGNAFGYTAASGLITTVPTMSSSQRVLCKNCVALGDYIKLTDNQIYPYTLYLVLGRICAGYTMSTTAPRYITYENNYANAHMLVGDQIITDGTTTNKNGQDITPLQYNNKFWWKTTANYQFREDMLQSENPDDYPWVWDASLQLPVLYGLSWTDPDQPEPEPELPDEYSIPLKDLKGIYKTTMPLFFGFRGIKQYD